MVHIRVDANSIIATGHIMRCMTIAIELEKLGEKCVFIIADKYPEEILQSKGFNTICINSNWKNLDQEIDIMKTLIEKENIEKLLVDSYYASEEYINTLNKYTRIAYIGTEYVKYDINMLINYSIDHFKYDFDSLYKNTNTKLLLGFEYVPLRAEFKKTIVNINEKVKDVLITAGGADQYNILGNIINSILLDEELESIRFHIISSKFNDYIDNIRVQVENRDNIILYENINNMSEIMSKCDIAISAGGTTLWELCTCGVPTICFGIADNQIKAINEFGNRGLMVSVGDARNNHKLANQILVGLKKLIYNFEERKKYSIKMSSTVDGYGAERIAKEIINMMFIEEWRD